jgi:ATP-independent RNA helicase DbpA
MVWNSHALKSNRGGRPITKTESYLIMLEKKIQIQSFTDFGLSSGLLNVLTELGFTSPSPIQSAAIPLILAGKDLRGQAATGSGKTAAFGLPILERVLAMPEAWPHALILCPTRELASQVAREIRKFGRKIPSLHVLELVGGAPSGPQRRALERKVHVIVGTPGRVLDHLSKGALKLADMSFVVLDEADRMLDMGFSEDMEEILSQCHAKRQTLLFSATFPDAIAAFSESFQRDPETVKTASEERPRIEEFKVLGAEDEKANVLEGVLKRELPNAAIVFCNQKVTVADLTAEMRERGIPCTALHGDLEQHDRDCRMALFRNGSAPVLIATDVAARGLDVQGLDLVVNFDLPDSDVYIHRIGRTGRAGKSGRAVSFVLPAQERRFSSMAAYDFNVPEAAEFPAPKMRTLWIGGGRKDNMRPGDILGSLTGQGAGLPGNQIGKIEIHDRFSYVAVASDVAELAMQRLLNGRMKGRKVRVEAVDL